MAIPIAAGIAASLIANHLVSSSNKPIPPVYKTLTKPNKAIKLNFLYFINSKRPHPSGKASAAIYPPLTPKSFSPLNFNRIKDGKIMLNIRSTIGRDLCVKALFMIFVVPG